MKRICLLLLACGALFAQRYAASDDGRVVYFSGRPSTLTAVPRLWAWEGDRIRTVMDGWSLETLSSDGQWVLVRSGSSRWQLLRHGTTVWSADAALAVVMSRNGRWLAVERKAGLARMEIVGATIREAGVVRGEEIGWGRSIADDGTVYMSCSDASGSRWCAWAGGEFKAMPVGVGPGDHGRFLYFWRDSDGSEPKQTLHQYDRIDGRLTEMPAECPKRFFTSYAPSGRLDYAGFVPAGSVKATDVSGRTVLLGCSGISLLDTLTGRKTAVPVDANFNSTFTRVLTRPAAERFAWAPVGSDTGNISGYDSIGLFGPLNGRGVLTYAGEPDFTLTWGGQEMPWLRGAQGYAYAPVPRDVVEGAEDAVTITSTKRPWLNVTERMTVSPPTPMAVPLTAANTGAAFIHGDYRGFVTATSMPKRGDYLHLLISGVEVDEVAEAGPLEASYGTSTAYTGGFRPPQRVSLPVVALGRVDYHPSMTQVTVLLPENSVRVLPEWYGPSLVMTFKMRDGRWAELRMGGFLRY